MSFLTKIFGSSNQRSLKRMQVIVDHINDLESDYQKLSNEELAGLRDVLKKNSEKMPEIFLKMFNCSPSTVINFLSDKSNIYEDFSIILKMPKMVFLKELF